MERIYPSLRELQRNMDANAIQRMAEERAEVNQRTRELEGSLGLALQSINRLEMRVQATEASTRKEEPKKAQLILMEDNLTKSKRALMTPKELCPTARVVQTMERQGSINIQEARDIAKMQETLIKKDREYGRTFPKYNRESRKGQEWCARICFHAKEYNVETNAADKVKFAIYGAIEGNMKNRVLHLEPGTIGFESFTPAEYLEEMLGRFMNARTKGGAKEEFER